MRWTTRRLGVAVLAVVLAVTALLATGCTLPGTRTPATPGSLAARGIDLRGQTITVGGKDFDEQLFLCEAEIAALQSVGATTVDHCNIHGVSVVRQALLTGQIDMYWSYTGTAWVTDLGQNPPVRGDRSQYEATRDLDRRQNHVVWTEPTPFNDTYAIATTRAFAGQHHLATISDWAGMIQRGDPEATTCVEPEFAGRADGLPNLLAHYGVTRPYAGPPGLTTVDTGLVYQATHNGSPCRFGEVYTTDGRVTGLDLALLRDDRRFFPSYNASNSIREDVVRRAPGVVEVSNEIAKRLDDTTMRELNGQMSNQGRDAVDVARAWLTQQGLIGP